MVTTATGSPRSQLPHQHPKSRLSGQLPRSLLLGADLSEEPWNCPAPSPTPSQDLVPLSSSFCEHQDQPWIPPQLSQGRPIESLPPAPSLSFCCPLSAHPQPPARPPRSAKIWGDLWQAHIPPPQYQRQVRGLKPQAIAGPSTARHGWADRFRIRVRPWFIHST